MKDTHAHLTDLLRYIALVAQFTRSGREALAADIMAQFAVIRAYEVIGEICKRLPPETLDTQPSIKWQAIKGFRDYLAHHYDDEVVFAQVWRAVEDLPNLKAAVEAMLRTLPPPETEDRHE